MNKEGTIGFLGKGFGFIKVQGEKKDIFFHATELIDVHFDDLRLGDAVEFADVVTTAKGTSATGISFKNQ